MLSFAEYLKESKAHETPHLADKVGFKATKHESKYQFSADLSANHGVTKKVTGRDGKHYYFKKDKVAGVWNSLESTGHVYRKE